MARHVLIISDTLHEDKTVDIAFYGVYTQTIGLIYCNVTLRLPFGLPLKTAIFIFIGLRCNPQLKLIPQEDATIYSIDLNQILTELLYSLDVMIDKAYTGIRR